MPSCLGAHDQGEHMAEIGIRAYRLTAAGAKALESKRSVPTWYRAILELVQGDTTSSVFIAAMSARPRKEVVSWIEELETLGFLELATPVGSEQPAEATGEFAFDVVLARLRAA